MRADRANRFIIACLLGVAFLSAGIVCQNPIYAAEAAKPAETKQELPSLPEVAPPPEQKISPIEPETVERAARGFERGLQGIGTRISDTFGRWVGANIFLGVTWLGLIACLLALVLVSIVDGLVRRSIDRRLQRLSSAGKALAWMALFLEALSKPLSLFIWAYGIYGALSLVLIQLHPGAGGHFLRTVAARAADIGGSVAIIWLAYRLVVLSDVRIKARAAASDSKIDQLLVGIVGRTLRIVIILIGGVILVQNVTGIQMGPLIASLGLGGLAIALAAKESVANLLGTLTIIFDKPFQIGDQVVIDKYEGTVDSVGFRSTRIRTPDGHLLAIPNSKMVDSPLQNVGRRSNIRWSTNIGLSYDTPPAKVRRAIEILEDTLRDHEGMREELPPRIHFNAFKEGTLNIAIVAWYHPPVWWDYQDWLQKTCMEILERFDQEGIRLATPSQVIQLPPEVFKLLEIQKLKGEIRAVDESAKMPERGKEPSESSGVAREGESEPQWSDDPRR